jgi:hypothetical protein
MATEEPMDVSANIEVILVRMEGKIDRFGDRLDRFEADTMGIRGRLHDISNILQPLVALNISTFISDQKTNNASVDERIKTLEHELQQRNGARALARGLWVVVGAVGVSGIAAIINFLARGGF